MYVLFCVRKTYSSMYQSDCRRMRLDKYKDIWTIIFCRQIIIIVSILPDRFKSKWMMTKL